MCLELVDKETRTATFGYKAFKLCAGGLYSMYLGEKPIPMGEWINEKDYRSSHHKQAEKVHKC